MDSASKPIDIYARISDDRDGLQLGVERQVQNGRQQLASMGLEIGAIIIDNDVSGWDPKVVPPGFEDLVQRLEDGISGGVWQWRLDRLTRQSVRFERFVVAYKKYPGRRFITSEGEHDLYRSGKFTARVLVAHSELSSEDTSIRLKDRNLKTALKGQYKAAWRAFGWADDKVSLHPTEAAHAVEGARLMLSRVYTAEGLAWHWREHGVLTARGRQWRGDTIKQYYLSPRVAGYQVYQGKVLFGPDGSPVRGQHEPILEPDVWEALCVELRTKATGVYNGANKYLLNRIIRCGRCHHTMHGNARSDSLLYEYHCPSKMKHGCGGIGINGRKTDEIITELVMQYLSQREIQRTSEPWPGEQALAKELATKDRNRLEWDAGNIANDTYFANLAVIDRKLVAMRAERSEWLRRSAAKSNLPSNIRETWPTLSLFQRNAIIGTVIQAVVVSPATRRMFQPERLKVVWRDEQSLPIVGQSS